MSIFHTSGIKYYSLKQILSRKAHYNMIIGERSNGKTYATLKHGLKHYLDTGGQMAYIRRWEDDFKRGRANQVFEGLRKTGEISKMTGGKFDKAIYKSGAWYLATFDETLNKDVTDSSPFCFSFALTSMEHNKSANYDGVEIIIFDEFLSRGSYVPDEFSLFTNTLSTIIRQRVNVTIFMLGNTVNKYCPYFSEMGITNIKTQKQGTIDVYTYGESELKVAVEYCGNLNKSGKPSDVYFAFGNPKLQMITSGVWELEIYPHCPHKFKPKDVIFSFFIDFDNELLQCDVVDVYDAENKTSYDFVFIHRKTTPIRKPFEDLVYSTEQKVSPNYSMRIDKPYLKVHHRIWHYFANDLVYYQDNEVGEIVRNYLLWCKKH